MAETPWWWHAYGAIDGDGLVITCIAEIKRRPCHAPPRIMQVGFPLEHVESFDHEPSEDEKESVGYALGDCLPVVTCPRCGAPQFDHDGFGALACYDPECGWCSHPDVYGDACNLCGVQVVG